MLDNANKAGDRRGPKQNEICAVSTLAASSTSTDLSAAAQFGNDHYLGRFVRLIADQAVYYFWTDTAAQTVDPAATSGVTRGDLLPAGECREEKPAGRYLVHRAAVDGTIRISIVEQNTRDVYRTT